MSGKKYYRRVAVIILALCCFSANGATAADNCLPTPTPPLAENAPQFEHGVPPQELCDLLKTGETEAALAGGAVLTLSIDRELQAAVFDLFRRYDPPYGAFAAMEPDTGRVVALVGYKKGGESDPYLALRASYPAASLVKVITAAAAIELGGVSPDDEIRYRGGIYKINPSDIHSDEGGNGMTLEEAIARSANSVFGKVAVRDVGAEALGEYLEKFGFGAPVPFDLPVEQSRAVVPENEYALARTGSGFGDVHVSPLHMAMVMSALAPGGAMPRPFLVDRIVDERGVVVYEPGPSTLRDVVSAETAQAVVRMLVKTIEMGTSRRAFGAPDKTPLLQDMEVAGKTGSLSGVAPDSGWLRFEWFAGLAPVDSPRLALATFVANNNHGKIKGSYVGKEAFSFYFGYPPSDPPVYLKAKAKRRTVVAGKKKNVKKATVKKKNGAAKKSARVTAPSGAPENL